MGARRCGGRTPLESLDCSNGAGSGGAGALLCTAGTHGAALKLCSRGCRCSSGVLWTTRTEIPERVGERGLGGAGRWERRAPPANGGAFLCGTALGGCGCASSLLPHWLHVYAITLCTAWHVWQHICRIAENREKFAHRARQRFADVQKRLSDEKLVLQVLQPALIAAPTHPHFRTHSPCNASKLSTGAVAAPNVQESAPPPSLGSSAARASARSTHRCTTSRVSRTCATTSGSSRSEAALLERSVARSARR